jgi:UDP-N-acetylmuramoyl-tripeptide--D-alanyl-D-alanine ligase
VIPVRLAEVEGVRAAGDPGVAIGHIAVDSRLAVPGSLFVCLCGSRHDGHDFAGDAVARGAVAVLGEPGRTLRRPGLATLEAADPLAALGLLARTVRRRSQAMVVGVAGAAGKTSTKDVLHALLAAAAPTVASPASFNNLLGVSLTLALLEPETRVCVCELGTSGPGQLASVCRIAEPDVGVLTAVGPEHLETLGSVAGAVAGEAELLAELREGSPLVLPYGEPLLDPYRRGDLEEWTFGLDAGADVHPVRWEPAGRSTEVTLRVRGETVAMTTNLGLPHHMLNLAAATAAVAALGLPLEAAAEGAASISLSPWRCEEHRLAGGGLVINDAYNANPVSMMSALQALDHRRDGARSVAILGEMAELGAESERWHVVVGEAVARSGVDVLVAIGPLADGYLAGTEGRVGTHWFPDREAAVAALPALLRAGDAVLLKGSRAAGLEQLTDTVLAVLAPLEGERPAAA